LAKTDPHALGLPFSCSSLAKLTAHLAREKITRVGREGILRTQNVTFQTTTTWKPSYDPAPAIVVAAGSCLAYAFPNALR
jgi:hypothetical protein